MPLNDAKVKNAKPREKAHRLSDERGMYLEVAPNGGKYWRMAYRFEGKRKLLALGTYPDVSLATARELRDDARRQLASGIDPSGAKQAVKRAKFAAASGSFEIIAREWLAQQKGTWAEITYGRIESLFDRDIFPHLGSKAIKDIAAPEVLAMARRIEARGALETAHRTVTKCGQVFRYAVATGRAERDPTGDLRGALPPVQGAHRAAITDPQRVGEMLRMLDGHKGTAVVRAALKLAPLLMARPGELRRARWADIDLDGAEWRYHARTQRGVQCTWLRLVAPSPRPRPFRPCAARGSPLQTVAITAGGDPSSSASPRADYRAGREHDARASGGQQNAPGSAAPSSLSRRALQAQGRLQDVRQPSHSVRWGPAG